MHPVRSRRLIAAVAVPLLVAALAACGPDDSTSADQDSTSAASSSSPSDEQSSESPPADQSDDVQAGESIDPHDFVEKVKSGVGEMTTAKVHMETTGGPGAMTAEGQVDYSTTPPSMQMTMQMAAMGNQNIEMRLIGKTKKMYMKMGDLTGGKFMALDLDDPNSPLGNTDSLTNSMDPVKSFEMFESGMQKVVFVGSDAVDGEAADHYKLTIDTSTLQTGDAATEGVLPKTMRYDMWLDGDGRVRQTQVDMGKLGTTKVTITDLGTPVKITAPPASEVTTSGMGGMG
ncbi:MAG: LppX_LprAFG lipoprotein [Nocardioides sp.]|uniref:DUF6612 family protein n=1 Tax=Nocardioides sp. TaxID=35761 RepID=UPI0039E7226E